MRSVKCLFFLFLLFPCVIFCQGPGYMGKRMVVGYGMYANPVTFGSTANNKSLFGNTNGSSETGYFRLNFTQELFFEGATSKSTMAGLSLKYMQTGYDNRAGISNINARPEYYYKIRVLTFTPYIKKYFSKYIAPWGRYFIVAPVINVIRSKHDAYMHINSVVNNHDTLITDFGPDNKRYVTADLLLGFGNTRVLFNTLTVDYGFHFQVISTTSVFEPLVNGFLTYEQEEYISSTIKKRVRAANRFNFFLKLGYLF